MITSLKFVSFVGSIKRSIMTCRPSSLLKPRIISRGCIWGEFVLLYWPTICWITKLLLDPPTWPDSRISRGGSGRNASSPRPFSFYFNICFNKNLCYHCKKCQSDRPCQYWDTVRSPWHPECQSHLQPPGGRTARYQDLPGIKRSNHQTQNFHLASKDQIIRPNFFYLTSNQVCQSLSKLEGPLLTLRVVSKTCNDIGNFYLQWYWYFLSV